MVDAKLTNLPSLANALAQVVQLGAADLAAAHHGDVGDVRRVEREHALDALAEGDLADRERGAELLAVLARDADALVVLHPRAGALGHLVADAGRDHVLARQQIGGRLLENVANRGNRLGRGAA